MQRNFTPEKLTAYLYNELSISERLDVEDALLADPVLADNLEDMRRAKAEMPQVKFDAPGRSICKILRYSRETAIGQPC